ncbi:ABC transporter ATP-binding protein [Clostridium kluyveri]|uniref:ABC transporter domain-containing protein n=1 Tax=Clostridium kluyveri TaxID=1534 RepID=A0A1L5FCR3_CLOKL|nr:ABC transporter ATP-binding protein [Clostridium kluyveri]APM40798.1 hypothetical protein BS101_19835 [Clostridium kluyveri]
MNIKIKNLYKKFRNREVLKNINYDFYEGYKYAIIGPNGSGKTMLLKALSGLIIPSQGSIYIDNKEMHKDFRFYESLGLIIETTKFYPNLTGYENLKLLASIRKKISDEHIIKTLKEINLLESKDQQVKKYSLGMIQRLAIGQAIMEEPKILLLDEPTIALDDDSRDMLFNILDQFKRKNKIIIVATNEKHDLKDKYDKFVLISDGEIKRSGDINDY